MSSLEKLRFPALKHGGANYVTWSLEARNHLRADGLISTIQDDYTLDGNTDKQLCTASKAVCLILRHLPEEIKSNYLDEENPSKIWHSLKLRFDTDRKTALLPLAIEEWNKLYFYNFKTVAEFSSEVYRITTQLGWCGKIISEEDKIEKTLTTVHPCERILAAQHRKANHTMFDQLIAAMLIDEKHGILLQRNHEERPIPGSLTTSKQPEKIDTEKVEANFSKDSKRSYKRQWKKKFHKQRKSEHSQKVGKHGGGTTIKCFKCGMKGHKSPTCRTSEFHCRLYKNSLDKTDSKHHRQTSDSLKKNKTKTPTTFMSAFSDDDEESNIVEVFNCEGEQKNTIIDSGTTNAILNKDTYFLHLDHSSNFPIKTIGGQVNIARGRGKAEVQFPNGTKLKIKDAIYVPTATRNLLSFANFRINDMHLSTAVNDNGKECLKLADSSGIIKEEFCITNNNLYYTTIHRTSANKDNNDIESLQAYIPLNNNFSLWHDRLGHPGIHMLKKLIKSTDGINLQEKDISANINRPCQSCTLGKNNNRQKIHKESFFPGVPLRDIHADVSGPFDPPCGPYRYFLVIKCRSTRIIYVHLLTSRNSVMPKLLTTFIKMRTRFPDYPTKTIRVDNAPEFISKSFATFCASSGIELQMSVPYAHNTNAENAVKQIQMIARTILMRSNLPISCWGHAVLHAADLVQLRPSTHNQESPIRILNGYIPSVSHLKCFGSAVYVPIPQAKRKKFEPLRQLGIYIGFISPSIIRYLDPSTGNVFTAHTSMCEYDESIFPTLINQEASQRKEPTSIFHPSNSLTKDCDPCTGQGEKEVRRILHLHHIANEAPDVFTPTERITESQIKPAENLPASVQIDPTPARFSIDPPKKLGRPKGAKDIKPRKRPSSINSTTSITAKDNLIEIASYFIEGEDLAEPRNITDCQNSDNWPAWKESMKCELQQLRDLKVFGPVQECPDGFTPIKGKWVFVRKRDENGKIIRFKSRYVAQGFSQEFGVNYFGTYAPVMDKIQLRWMIAFAASNNLTLRQADVVTAYLYGKIDVELYITLPPSTKPTSSRSFTQPCMKILKSLYGLKQAGRIWYLHFSEFLVKRGFTTHECCPCLFVKKQNSDLIILGLYVDDIIMIGTDSAIRETMAALKVQFKIKDLGQLKYCLGLSVVHTPNGIILHQAGYIKKLLTKFGMDDVSKFQKTPMVVRTLNPESDVFGPRRDSEEVLPPEYPYREAIGGLMYLSNCSRPDIAFATNLLARFCQEPTKRHWSGIKHLLRYLAGTIKYGLFYRRGDHGGVLNTDDILGYADAGYLSDPHRARSQTGFIFMMAKAALAWKSTKQTLVATSTNLAELIALYEATKECVWIRNFLKYVRKALNVRTKLNATIIYEDNRACIAQVQQGYIKGERTKHIDPKFFFTHELNGKEVDIKAIASTENLADLLTKSLGSTLHWKLMIKMGFVDFTTTSSSKTNGLKKLVLPSSE
jgi:hypothetical protein